VEQDLARLSSKISIKFDPVARLAGFHVGNQSDGRGAAL
jgi:hypothetical protein